MRKMKDSGIEWIGEIPEDWKITTIGNLFFAKAGGDVKPNYYSYEKDDKHPFPVYTNSLDKNQIYAYTSTPIFPKNSITVTGRGDIGHAIFRDTEFDAIIRLNVLTSKIKLDEKYYTYFIDTVIPFFTNSAAIGQLSANQITPYRICYLPFSEQQKISAFLDRKCTEIDSVISKTKATIEEYKKLKQSVITQAVTKGIIPNRPMKDSGIEWIGEIPQEWEIIKSRYVIKKITDIDHYMPTSVDVGIPYVMIGNLSEKATDIDFDNCKQISKNDFEILSKKSKAQKGDIIFARYATIGTVCYVNLEKDFLVSYACVIINPNSMMLNGLFLYYYLKSATFLEDVGQYINSNTQNNVGIESLYKIKLTLPPIYEQQEIANYLDEKCSEIDKLIAKKEQLLTEMENYKKAVIYEYVTGKKEVE